MTDLLGKGQMEAPKRPKHLEHYMNLSASNEEYPIGIPLVGVARVLGVNYNAVHYLVTRAKRLKAVRSGSTWLVDPESVRTYKAELEAKETAEGSAL